MRGYTSALADHVQHAIWRATGSSDARRTRGTSPGGDTQFEVDDVAERAVKEFITSAGRPVALYSEDGGLEEYGSAPQHVLIVDPIDGTRPAAADLEMACISIAVAKYHDEATIDDVQYALLKEIKTGCTLYSDRQNGGIEALGYEHPVPALSSVSDLRNMFWSLEFNGHPADIMIAAYGHLIDLSANRGGVFCWSSASYSISRIITGQLDAYVDVGNRVLKDRPETKDRFLQVGGGHILHLFPYDIAAAVVLAEQAGVVITDAYGQRLGRTRLLDLHYSNQQSCIAASTPELHEQLLSSIAW
jgi:myo-inositol-1(or 4)-monophosphatase